LLVEAQPHGEGLPNLQELRLQCAPAGHPGRNQLASLIAAKRQLALEFRASQDLFVSFAILLFSEVEGKAAVIAHHSFDGFRSDVLKKAVSR